MHLIPLLLLSLLPSPTPRAQDAGPTWHDAASLTLEGQAWTDTKAPFDRLPAKAETLVRPPVWNLSRHSAGVALRFATNAPEIHARWSLTQSDLAMPHMSATGVSGLDLYVRHDNQWRWLGLGKPTAQDNNTARLAKGLTEEWREYMLYLPLYNGTSSLEVGIPSGSEIKPGAARPEAHSKPIVVYGTSITQGACASRPGMTHLAILGRRLDREVINLGFSGNGTLDLPMGDLLAEIDAAVYILDCLPNMRAGQVTERAVPFTKSLRKARPSTPILMVEDRSYGTAFLEAGSRLRNEGSRVALKAAFDALSADGVSGLHYLPGDNLVGTDGEGLVD
ncbi:MAG: hypothetical protein ACI82F_001298, partial [Planctomycetota bacterium]